MELENRGLVSRNTCLNNRRKVEISLTKLGKRNFESWRKGNKENQ